MSINIIVAVANDGAIGQGGNQPFFIAEDLRRFKTLTLGHPIVMGRKTFEALPKGALPGRRNIVVTRNETFSAPGAETAGSLDEAIRLALESDSEIYIIGGASIYRQALSMAHKVQLTRVYADFPEADAHFPQLDGELWAEEWSSEKTTDPKTGLSYQFHTLHRV